MIWRLRTILGAVMFLAACVMTIWLKYGLAAGRVCLCFALVTLSGSVALVVVFNDDKL